MPVRPVVAAAIVDSLAEPSLILAAQRSYPKKLDGLFELPGGKVEYGEDPRDALDREIREELGTRIILGEPVPSDGSVSLDWPRDLWRKTPGFAPWQILEGRVMWVWLAQIPPGASPARVNGSHRTLLWVPLKDALQIPWIPTNLPIVQNTLTRIATSGAEPPTNPSLPLTL